MVARMITKNQVIKRLEYLKTKAECMTNGEKSSEDAIALSAAIHYIKQKRKEDAYIIKTSISLTLVILSLVLFIWEMG